LSTFFLRVTEDIYNWNCDKSFTFSIPKNLFNVREIYFFNSRCDCKREGLGCQCGGTSFVDSGCQDGVPPVNCGNGGQAGTGIGINCVSDCCNDMSCWGDFVTGYWKRQFNRFGSSGQKTAERTRFYDERYAGYIPNLYGDHKNRRMVYFGIQNGKICVSDTGKCFNNVRIVANGFGSDNCELPIIPRELRNVCVDTLKLKGCEKLMLLYPEYKQMYQIYKLDLYGDNTVQNPGSQLKAERFILSLNSKQREDYNRYYSNPDIK
jgi:hypothetical protein